MSSEMKLSLTLLVGVSAVLEPYNNEQPTKSRYHVQPSSIGELIKKVISDEFEHYEV